MFRQHFLKFFFVQKPKYKRLCSTFVMPDNVDTNVSKTKFVRFSSNFVMPDIDLNYYCDPKNAHEIDHNIKIRKGVGNVQQILNLYNSLMNTPDSDVSHSSVKEKFYGELFLLPNKTHPDVKEIERARKVQEINKKREFDEPPMEFSHITRRLNLMRTDKLGHTCGHKSYYFLGELAELEEALIKYTVNKLLENDFHLISVPDILPGKILNSCGMPLNSDRTQIFSLDPVHHGPDLHLSGTAEMSLAGMLMNNLLYDKDLPLKLAAVSRCYRAETSNVLEERGVYRVHQFTKVEMFAVTAPSQSDDMLEYLRNMQLQLFSPLDLHMQVLDMPPHELGAPAYRKYDIEAWMPGRRNYGEISSCSNCTDYQSRRLNIKFCKDDVTNYVHTLNGTACAIPRMLIALLETHQDPKGKINIPEILQPYMNGKKHIGKNNLVPELKLAKIKR